MKTVIVFIIGLSIIGATSQVFAWEEQLEGCRIRGIPPESCPDDESFVGVPYQPPAPPSSSLDTTVSRGRSSEGYGESRVWVLVDYKNVDDHVICYSSYERRIFRHRGWITYWNNRNTTMEGCVRFPIEKPINLVLDRVWYYE